MKIFMQQSYVLEQYLYKSALKPAGFRNHQLQSITDKHVKCLLEYADFLASKAKYQALHHAASHSSDVEQLNSVNTIPPFIEDA